MSQTQSAATIVAALLCRSFPMRFDIFTLFPGFFDSPFNSSILKRAQEAGLLQLGVHDIRAWTTDKHHVCDDTPYGGGAGMVLKAEPLARAVADVLEWDFGQSEFSPCPVVLMSPQGRPFSQQIAQELSQLPRIALICGHYEGIDERAVEMLCSDEISVGDFVLTGGEAAALCVVEATARLIPGVLGNEASAQGDTFSQGLLEAPHYTRPVEWRGNQVPDVLLSGHHGEIEKWRWKEGARRTMQRRPDLWRAFAQGRAWTKVELKLLAELEAEGTKQQEN